MVLPSRPGVQDVYCGDAAGFLDTLSPRHPLWAENPEGWFFRGHANAEWKLEPTAARRADAFALFGGGAIDALNAFAREDELNRMLDEFQDGLESEGLPVPVAGPTPHRISRSSQIHYSVEPDRERFPLMALAQHTGLPTIFLDWTRRAYVAAYFAAADLADPTKNLGGSHLAVWAMRYPERGQDGCLRIYEAPASTNPNLHAQSGIFTIVGDENEPGIEAFYARTHPGESGFLRRVLLPVGCALELLKLLSYEGVHGAKMFPGPDGVKRRMRERALWDKRR